MQLTNYNTMIFFLIFKNDNKMKAKMQTTLSKFEFQFSNFIVNQLSFFSFIFIQLRFFIQFR